MPTRAAISLRALAISSACARLSSRARTRDQRERQPVAEAHGADGDHGMGSGIDFDGHGVLKPDDQAGHGRRVNLAFCSQYLRSGNGAATGGLLYKRSKILFFQAVWLDLRARLPHIEWQPFTTII